MKNIFINSIGKKIYLSIILIILLYSIVVGFGYLKVRQLEVFAEEAVPQSLQVSYLQEFALALASLERQIDKFFVVGYSEYHERANNDIDQIFIVLNKIRGHANKNILNKLNKLEELVLKLRTNVQSLTKSNMSQGEEVDAYEINDKIIIIYDLMEDARSKQVELLQASIDLVQANSVKQKDYISEMFRQLLIFVSVILILGIALAVILSKVISRPIKDLIGTAIKLGQGDLSAQSLIKSHDEIGRLSKVFNEMAIKLKASHSDLENKIKERTFDLEKAKKNLEGQNLTLEDTQKATIHILKDVNKQKEVITSEKEKIGTILQSIGDGVFVIDKDYKIVVFNKHAEKISGFSAKYAIGKKYNQVLKFVFEDSGEVNDRLIKKCMTEGKIVDMVDHTVIIRKNGQKRPVSNSAAPLKDKKGNIIGCVVVFRDITLAREVDKMKNEFVSVASHQLRTPLTAIKLFTEMLIGDAGGNLNKDQKEYLSNIDLSVKRMVRLVNDLLNVARIESGRLKIDPVLTNVETLVADVIAEAKPLAKTRSVKISINTKARLPEIPLDQSLFRQAIHNLTTNAIRYSREKGGKVNIEIDKADDEYFIVSVHDNGIGIAKEAQDRIFQKFFRADNAVKTATEGTGLGLYLVKMIVDQADGNVWFDSEPDKGTTFYVKLPLKGMQAKEGEQGLAMS